MRLALSRLALDPNADVKLVPVGQGADALAASGDYENAADLLREADGLWRGQALTGIRGDWIGRMRDSLSRASARSDRVLFDVFLIFEREAIVRREPV